MVNSTPDMSTPKPKSGFLRKLLVVTVPLLIIGAFVLGTYVYISANKKPKEKKRSFNTLAVIADYAKQEDVQLQVRTQGEARPQVEIDLVPEVGGKIVYVSPNFIEGGIFKKGETVFLKKAKRFCGLKMPISKSRLFALKPVWLKPNKF